MTIFNKTYIVILSFLILLFSKSAYASYFPEMDLWTKASPENQNISSEKVNILLDLSFTDSATQAVVVIKDGKIIFMETAATNLDH